MEYLGWLCVGVLLGGGTTYFASRFKSTLAIENDSQSVLQILKSHFHPATTDTVTISERKFPFRVRADLQRAIDRLFSAETKVFHFCGVRTEFSHEGISMTDCIVDNPRYSTHSVPPEYEELDIGDEMPVRVLKVGLWMLEKNDVRFAVLLSPAGHYDEVSGIQFQVATPNSPAGTRIAQEFFKYLEDAVLRAESYRGKVLSLEQAEPSYTGESAGITVHKLRNVERDQVILPESRLKLLERNVIQFVKQRKQLASYNQSTSKGILFYGPPGTGKTHTIHYLTRALNDHTTLLISAEQVGLLSEYMTLARLLQPSIVVMEDVDLIARDRADMNSACEEVMLNKLLNEMDGLKQDSDIMFILTTNRPEALESALASRPGRVDQAIEYPLPDDIGRGKLVRLYSKGVDLADDITSEIVRRTEGVSPAFIKELMRRSVQYHVERNGTGDVSLEDVTCALDEMLINGGVLNLKLLGANDVRRRES